MRRRLYLDDGVGERRGVVTLDGRPERLLIERIDDIPAQQPGARVVARVRKLDRALRTAFIDLGEGPDGALALTGDAASLAEGAWIEVSVNASARRGKGAMLGFVGRAEGPGRVMQAAPPLDAQLTRFAPGETPITGAAAREAADLAEETALAVEHPLPGGGRLFIEPTQALTAVDVDVGAASGNPRQAVVRANLEAIEAAARLLRLKGLGGLVAIDLAGKGHDGARFSAVAKAAFAPDGAGVSIGPISRFGVMELLLPRTSAPLAERFVDEQGRPTALAAAYRLMRAIERAATPGVIVRASAGHAVAAVAERLTPRLSDRIGARFAISADEALPERAFAILSP
jgi:Ribonuclease G/E